MPEALAQGKIGYLGMDVYEYENEVFYGENSSGKSKDDLLLKLLTYPNVIITPHQAFLTVEALEEIAKETIHSLDLWQHDLAVTSNLKCL